MKKYRGFDLIPTTVLAKSGDPKGWEIYATFRGSCVHFGHARDLRAAKKKVDQIAKKALAR